MARVGRILVAIAAVVSLAGWSSPQQLERGPTRGLAIGGDGAGRRVVAWTSGTRVRLAVAKHGAQFGRARTVATGEYGPSGLQIAVNPSGDALLAWFSDTTPPPEDPPDPRDDPRCCTVVYTATLRHDGRLSRARVMSPRMKFGYDPVTAVGSGGRIGVAWTEEGEGFASFGTFRKGLGKREKIPASKAPVALSFDRRHARVEWLESVTSIKEVVHTAPRRYARPTTVLTSVINKLSFAADGLGRQVATWTEPGPSGERVRLGTRTPPAKLRERKLGRASDGSGGGPELAVDRSGAAVAAWIDPVPGLPVRVAMRGRDGGFRATKVPYSSPALYALTDASVAPGGGAAIGMWTQRADGHFEPRVALLRPNGSLRSVDTVTSQTDTTGPIVVTDSRGTAAAWGGGDETAGTGLWVSRAR